ncbi:MAG: FecR family protein [Candidatus Neomarinimicrobiota bacterium]|nr:FecR family protein [Candidatus Neomarinimicrobiota bacterium]
MKQSPLILISVLLGSFLSAQPPASVAVVTKVKGNVEIRKAVSNPAFTPVKAGQLLNDEDFIRTGANAFAVLIYLDDKSMVKLKGDTNLEIRGKRVGKALEKNIQIIGGSVRAVVSQQRRGEFSVTSPTSVASVKGTSFWMVTNSQTGDAVYNEEGVVQLTNLTSGDVVDLLANQTGTSMPDGGLSVAATIAANVPVDEDDSGQEPKELRIRFTDPDGTEKVLIVKYN